MKVEGITNARKFISAARHFTRTKPVIVVKSGRFAEGAKAATSHTGSLTGEDAVYDAAFKRAGIVRVDDIADLFNCAEALSMQPIPEGPNLAIITNAGGPGVMAADATTSRAAAEACMIDNNVDGLLIIYTPQGGEDPASGAFDKFFPINIFKSERLF